MSLEMVFNGNELVQNGRTQADVEDEWLVLHPEANHHNKADGACEEEPSRSGQSSDSSSSSSASSSSSPQPSILDDLIEIDTSVLDVGHVEQSDLKHDEHNIDITNPFLSVGLDDASQVQTPGSETFSLTTPESGVQDTSPMLSPAVQVMERDGDYDPDRIPFSVFQRCDSLIPAEWSVTSTESLFSIHAGNSSFGRDFNFLPTGELGTAGDGEISKPGEFPLLIPCLSTPAATPVEEKDVAEVNVFTGILEAADNPSPPAATQAGEEDVAEVKMSTEVLESAEDPYPPAVTEARNKDVSEVKTFTEILESAEKTKKDMGKTYPVDQEQTKAPPPTAETLRCSSRSRPSDGSDASNCSFAFPILAPTEQVGSAKSDPYQPHHLDPPIEPQYSAVAPNGSPHKKSSSYFSCCSLFSCSLCCSFSFSRLCGSCKPCGFCGSFNSCRPCGFCCSSPFTSGGLCYTRRSCNLCWSCKSRWTCSCFSCLKRRV